jgi:hypothetical protein
MRADGGALLSVSWTTAVNIPAGGGAGDGSWGHAPVDRDEYAVIMTSASEWDFTVPDNDAELLAELGRHGDAPAVGLHVALSAGESGSAAAPEVLPAFIASFSEAPDLAERSGEILRAEFPHGR